MPNPADQITDDTTLDPADVAGAGGDTEVDDGAAGDQAVDADGSASNDDAGGEGAQASADDELLITLEGDPEAEPAPQDEAQAPSWVRDLRKENRAKERRIRELERQVAANQPVQPVVTAGPEPTLETCDFDSARYAKELREWLAKDAEVKRQAEEHRKGQEAVQAAYVKRLGDIETEAKTLRIAGADEAREAFETGLSVIQQAIVLNGPENAKTSAMLRHVIGANPAVAKRLAAIQDPVKFAFATAELVQKMKTTSRKGAPPPERRLSSGAVGTSAVDDALEAARKRAEKTGDRTEVARIMRQREQRQRAA